MKFKLKPLIATMGLVLAQGSQLHAASIPSEKPSAEQIRTALNGQQLIFKSGIFDPMSDQVSFAHLGINNVQSSHYGIVQFNKNKADYRWLNQQGFNVIQPIKNDAFIVNWQNADKKRLADNSTIRWYGPMQSGFKISPHLWPQNRSVQSDHIIEVVAYNDYPRAQLENLVRKAIPNVQFAPNNIPSNDHRVAINIPAATLDAGLNALSQMEGVQWLGVYRPERFFNEDAVPAVQDTSSNTIDQSIFDQGIYGTGQIVGVADSGLDRNENWFTEYDDGNSQTSSITDAELTTPPTMGSFHGDRKVVAYWIMPGATSYDHAWASFHGTHVSGSVAGDRTECVNIACLGGDTGTLSSPSQSGYDSDDGMAPNAQILFQDLGGDSALSGVGSSAMWEQAYQAGVRIHTNSYGASTLGEYVSSDQNLDRTLRQHEDMIVAFAAGNDDGTNNTTGSPGNAKSALTVGALGHGNSTTVAGFSNRGLTDDGRLKPDISATGSSIQSASGNVVDDNTLDLTPQKATLSGTSMSTPITAGATALLRQYFTDGFYPTGTRTAADSYAPSGPLMKAMLLNGSNPDSGFNYRHTGWGRPWLNNTLYFDGDSRSVKFWDVTNQSGLSTGESITYDVDVLAGEEFRATLTWYDLPGPTGSGVTLVNDLNLTVVAPDGTYLGNVFDSAVQAVSQTGGAADAINTVEQVRLTAPVSGTYLITVSAPDVPGDGTFGSDRQGYALVVGGALGTNNPQPLGDPSNLSVDSNDINGVDLSWSAANNAEYYEVYRSNGTCQSHEPGTMRFIGLSGSTLFSDQDAYGGYEFAYQVRAFNADGASAYSNCIDAVSAQNCPVPPAFNSSSAAISSTVNDSCQITVTWDSGTSQCPSDPNVSYNIYRDTSHNFVPSAQNLVATVNGTSFDDVGVTNGQSYYYHVSAVNNGNESPVSPELVGTPLGTTSANIGDLSDDVDNSSLMNLTSTWSISNDRSSSGQLSYRSTFEGAPSYTSNTCARMYSPLLEIPNSGSASVDYKAWWQIEAEWDGVVVEISTDGGNSWADFGPDGLPLNGYPSNFAQTGNPPINACGYDASQGAFGGASSGFEDVSHDLSAYAGQTVQIRWSFSTDPGYEEEGFYLDDLIYSNVHTPNVCSTVPNDLIFKDGFE